MYLETDKSGENMWVDGISNEEILNRTKEGRTLKRRKGKWIEHIIRRKRILTPAVEIIVNKRRTKRRKMLKVVGMKRVEVIMQWLQTYGPRETKNLAYKNKIAVYSSL